MYRQQLRSLGKKQLPPGFKDPSEWTYEQMRQWVREHDFPFEREASASGVTGKVVLNAKSLIFSVKGEVVGFDLGQLRTIEILDETTVSFSYSVGGEVRSLKLTLVDANMTDAFRLARRTLELVPDVTVVGRTAIPPAEFEARIEEFRQTLNKWRGRPEGDESDRTVRRGLEDMLDATDVLLTSSQILMTEMIWYEVYRKQATFPWKTHPEALTDAEEEMTDIEQNMAEIGLMPK